MIPVSKRVIHRLLLGVVLSGVWGLLQLPSASAEEIKIEARLVWGTNDDDYKNPKHKPVDEETAKKLRKMFKWKHYFVIRKKIEAVPNRDKKSVKMSDELTIEVREMQGAPVEVKVFGKGKHVRTITEPLNHGNMIFIGGDDENECAWFVILSRL